MIRKLLTICAIFALFIAPSFSQEEAEEDLESLQDEEFSEEEFLSDEDSDEEQADETPAEIPEEIKLGEEIPVAIQYGEDVEVLGTTWFRGERREYQILFDHIPVGVQSYTFIDVVKVKGDKRMAVVFELFHTVDNRFFGTPGRAVFEGRLVMDTKGRPIYYRLEESFNPTVRYSVNKPLMNFSDYKKYQFWVSGKGKKGIFTYAESPRRRGTGKKTEESLNEKVDFIYDYPLFGHFAMYFQFVPLEKRSKGKASVLVPLERTEMDYFEPQNVHSTVNPQVRKISYSVTREKKSAKERAGETESADIPKELVPEKGGIFRIEIPELRYTLWADRTGKILKIDTHKGLSAVLKN